MNRVTDAVATANQAIRYVISNPCAICSYGHPISSRCEAGVKYKGTCKVHGLLKGELLKMREIPEVAP